ncbi:MAG TPA: hypothetical protein VMG59_02020 [Phycisphaerae bacterium]|nr:hypothetical protein [Phycisphaerae bacterium]
MVFLPLKKLATFIVFLLLIIGCACLSVIADSNDGQIIIPNQWNPPVTSAKVPYNTEYSSPDRLGVIEPGYYQIATGPNGAIVGLRKVNVNTSEK